MRITFTKLFTSPTEGMMYKPSLIAFSKVPWERRIVEGQTFTSAYKYFLYLNLWLVELYFDRIQYTKVFYFDVKDTYWEFDNLKVLMPDGSWQKDRPVLYSPNMIEYILHRLGKHWSYSQPYCVICGKEKA